MEDNNFLNSEQYQRMNEYLQRQNDLLAPYLEMQQRINKIYNSEGYQAALRATEAWNNQASNPITLDLNSIVNDLTHNINSIKFSLPVLDTIANMPDYSSLFNRLNNTLSNYENNENIQNILMQEAPEEIAVKFNRVIKQLKDETTERVLGNTSSRPKWIRILVICTILTLETCKDQIVSKLFEDKQPTIINNLTIYNNTTIIQYPDGEKAEKSINVELDEKFNFTIEEQQQMIECINEFIEISRTNLSQTEE